jgi:ribosomal protein S17E
MPWIPSHQSLREHPKKDRLAELLFNGTTPNDVADYAAAGLLHYLWYWALDYAADGDLAKFSDRQIAKGCRWQGDPKALVQGLTVAGFMDDDRHIHDWEHYAGKLLEQREKNKQRVVKWREEGSKKGRNAHVTHNVRGREEKSKASAGARASTDAAPRARAKAKRAVDKSAAPVDNYCPKDGATLQADGHCPVCDKPRR